MQRLTWLCLAVPYASYAQTLSPSFPGTQLITTAHATLLFGWGVPQNVSWHVCYKSSRADGYSANTFHAGCDNQGRTVTVARLSKASVERIVGGFTTATWEGSDSYKTDSQAFLFSLTNSHRHEQLSSSGSHIYRHPSLLPYFGSSGDLYLTSSGYCNLGTTYACRTGSRGSEECEIDFCGTPSSFTLEELEVFREGLATTITTTTAVATTSTATTTTATTTSTTATTTTSATTTTTTCQAGYYGSGASCMQCPPGTHSRPGGACLQTLQQALSGLGSPDLSITSHGRGVVRMEISLPPVPAKILEGDVSYRVDVKPEAQQLNVSNDCDTAFGLSPSSSPSPSPLTPASMTATFAHSQLRGPCNLSEAFNESHVLQKGVLGLYLTLVQQGSSGVEILIRWVFPVRVDMTMDLPVSMPLHSWQTLWQPEKPPTHAGHFDSSLHFFHTNLFQTEKTVLIYHDGDTAWIEHRLNEAVSRTTVATKWVALSKQAELSGPIPGDENLTESIQVVDSSEGRARFSIQLTACVSCNLHVWSRLIVSGRLLTGERGLLPVEHYAYYKVPLVVYPRDDRSTPQKVQLVMPPPQALAISWVSSVAVGLGACVLTRQIKGHSRGHSKSIFFLLEFLDVGLDVFAYLFCSAEGDLEMEDNGWSATALLTSVVVSAVLFVLEVLILLFKSDWLEKTLPWFISFHVMGEDIFQEIWYCFVAASHSAGGLGVPVSLLCAIGQAGFFILAKFVSILEPVLTSGGPAYVVPVEVGEAPEDPLW